MTKLDEKSNNNFLNMITSEKEIKKLFIPTTYNKTYNQLIDKFNKLIVVSKNGCHEFTKIDTNGYGRFFVTKKTLRAHRMNYILKIGKIKKGFVLDHKCKNRSCVNPEHLIQVTMKENCTKNSNGAAAKNLIKTECIRNHKYYENNVYRTKKGRTCLTCMKRTNHLNVIKKREIIISDADIELFKREGNYKYIHKKYNLKFRQTSRTVKYE